MRRLRRAGGKSKVRHIEKIRAFILRIAPWRRVAIGQGKMVAITAAGAAGVGRSIMAADGHDGRRRRRLSNRAPPRLTRSTDRRPETSPCAVRIGSAPRRAPAAADHRISLPARRGSPPPSGRNGYLGGGDNAGIVKTCRRKFRALTI